MVRHVEAPEQETSNAGPFVGVGPGLPVPRRNGRAPQGELPRTTALAERAMNDAEIMRYVAGKQPLDGGRIGTPEDLDEAVIYLLSDEARFVTGQVLAVDGGWSVTEGQYDS